MTNKVSLSRLSDEAISATVKLIDEATKQQQDEHLAEMRRLLDSEQWRRANKQAQDKVEAAAAQREAEAERKREQEQAKANKDWSPTGY